MSHNFLRRAPDDAAAFLSARYHLEQPTILFALLLADEIAKDLEARATTDGMLSATEIAESLDAVHDLVTDRVEATLRCALIWEDAL